MFSSLSIRVWLCAFPSDHFKLIAFKLTGVADDPGLPYRMSLLVVALEYKPNSKETLYNPGKFSIINCVGNVNWPP